MQNARKYDEQITIGIVPTQGDLEQLKDLGYRTIIDVRDEQERFGAAVEKTAVDLGFTYVSIPVARDSITTQDAQRFYQGVFGNKDGLVYAFSRFGKKPLALILLFEAIARHQPIHRVFRRASNFGLNLEGDLSLRSFIVNMMNSGELRPVVGTMIEKDPALAKRKLMAGEHKESPTEGLEADDIQTSLHEADQLWTATRDRDALRKSLAALCRRLESGW